MGPIHCIVNPASRDHTCGKKWPVIKEKLESKGFEVNTLHTKHVGHAGELAWDLRNKNVQGIVVAVGGMAPCMRWQVLYEVVIFL